MKTATTSPKAQRPLAGASSRMFRRLSTLLLALLLAQVLLGMANNLWLSVPDSGPAWERAAPSVLIYSHMLLGISALAVAIWALVVAIRTQTRVRTLISVVGLLGIFGAILAGSAFMNDTSNDVMSFLMVIGCTVSIAAYALGLSLRTNPEDQPA